MLCVALIAATAWAVLAAGWVQRRWWRGRGGGHIGDRGGAPRSGACTAHRRGNRRAVPRTRGDRAHDARGDARRSPGQTVGAIAGALPARARSPGSRQRRTGISPSGCARSSSSAGTGWVDGRFASIAASSRSSRSSRFLPQMSSTRSEPEPDRAARRPSRWCSRSRVDRRRVSRIARRSLGGVAHHALDGSAGGSAAASPRVAAVPDDRRAGRCRPSPTTDISTRLFPHGLGIGVRKASGGGTPGGAVSATIGFNHVGRARRAAGQPAAARCMTYSVNTNATVYLRVANDTVFDKGSWFPEDSTNDPEPTSNWSSFTFPKGLLPRDNDRRWTAGSGRTSRRCGDDHLQAKRPARSHWCRSRASPRTVDSLASRKVLSRSRRAGVALLTVDEVKLEPGHRQRDGDRRRRPTSPPPPQAQLEAAGTDYPSLDQSVHRSARRRQPRRRDDSAALPSSGPPGITEPVRPGDRHRGAPPQPGVLHVHPQPAAGPQPGDVAGRLLPDHEPQGLLPVLRLGNGIDAPEPRSIPTRLVSGYGPGITRAQSGRSGQARAAGEHR